MLDYFCNLKIYIFKIFFAITWFRFFPKAAEIIVQLYDTKSWGFKKTPTR